MDSNTTSDQEPDELGGIGGQPAIDTRTGSRDMRLYEAAMNNGWPIPPAIRKLLVDELILLAQAKNKKGGKRRVSIRERERAMALLLRADSINAHREATAMAAGVSGTQVNVTTNVSQKVIVVEVEKDAEKGGGRDDSGDSLQASRGGRQTLPGNGNGTRH